MPSLGASFGRGAMTNHWLDLQNARVFLIAGSNAAENHVMSMKWVMKAKEKGAKVIHVDPRFTRTSSIADIYARIRPGADIAYLGAIINYIVQNKLYDEEYLTTHTNALLLVKDEFGFQDGLFSGYDEAGRKYDNASWAYQLDPKTKTPLKAASLDDPGSAFQKLARTPLLAWTARGFFLRRVNVVFYHGVWRAGDARLRLFGGVDAMADAVRAQAARIGRLCVVRLVRRARLLHLTLTPAEKR